MAVDEQLRNIDVVRLHPIPDFLLMEMAHEDITFLELHHESLQDLLHRLAFGISGSDDAHAGQVHDDLAAVFVFVILGKKRKESS